MRVGEAARPLACRWRSLSQVADAMQSGKPSDPVAMAIDGWYGDYLKGV
jgi:hypothetical protein